MKLRRVMQGMQEGWPHSLPFLACRQSRTTILLTKPVCQKVGMVVPTSSPTSVEVTQEKDAIWVLRGAEMEAEKREGYAMSSYIVIHQGASPSFGRAQYFLQHSFGHNQHFLAAVDWFGNPQLDTNNRLWFVPSSEAPKRSPIEIANLFRPFTTAIDDGQIVFKLF